MYQAEPEKKRVAKRQRYWKSSEPVAWRRECNKGRLNIHWNAIERVRTTDKVTQRYVAHVNVPVSTAPTVTIDTMHLLRDV